jgi:hypothetical protein
MMSRVRVDRPDDEVDVLELVVLELAERGYAVLICAASSPWSPVWLYRGELCVLR